MPTDELKVRKQITEKLERKLSAADSIRPLPKHWELPNGPLQRAIFQVLCICACGHSNLNHFWAVARLEELGDESEWVDSQRQTSQQQNNVLIVASLLLATSATFMTTTPPRTSMMNYTVRGPYLCFMIAYGLLLGGIIVSLICILVIDKITAEHAEKVLYATRVRVYCTLTIISFPCLSIGIGTILLAIGSLTAVWCAQDHTAQIIGAFLLALPLSMVFLIGISNANIKANLSR
ncbi:hypothetical protein M413DRAFT_422835 [Hebeloma cylindrosporum]|uniref:PGG domain-containing protein n=1 Tax=Hebeloma cylindrosporum TaxID=76867 RepID=A0A0C3CTC9_HEBCY|nr:hypothetical protein M413DRAFT_422835 [Hebeloma cylindrosporum h7]